MEEKNSPMRFADGAHGASQPGGSRAARYLKPSLTDPAVFLWLASPPEGSATGPLPGEEVRDCEYYQHKAHSKGPAERGAQASGPQRLRPEVRPCEGQVASFTHVAHAGRVPGPSVSQIQQLKLHCSATIPAASTACLVRPCLLPSLLKPSLDGACLDSFDLAS